jgi:hypothetical protein
MRSFLGVPIISGDRLLGQIYLTDKIDYDEFTVQDQHVIETLAAYAAVATQTFDFWANAATSTPERAIRREPAQLPAAFAFGSWPNPALDFLKMSNAWAANSPWGKSTWASSPWGAGGANGIAAQMAFSPVAAWWGMFPLTGNPASWPMAYGLMTAGMPREVAFPTAEANTAAIEAAEVATEAINTVFASYRSESGYAMAQVIGPRQLMTAIMLAPFGASLAFPWTMATRATGF